MLTPDKWLAFARGSLLGLVLGDAVGATRGQVPPEARLHRAIIWALATSATDERSHTQEIGPSCGSFGARRARPELSLPR